MNRSTALPKHWNSQNQNATYQNTVVLNNYFPDEYSGRGFIDYTYFKNSDFLRVRNIALGYDFSPGIINSMFFKELRLYCNLSNPFVLTSFEGSDPEISGEYPMQKSYTLGLAAKF